MLLFSQLTLRDVMTSPAITAASDWTVSKVIDLMLSEDISTVLIVDGQNRMVGLVSESSLLAAAFDSQLRSHPISLHMQCKFVSIDECDTIDGVIESFLLHRVRHLPVLKNRHPIGIISRRELLRHLIGSPDKRNLAS